MDGLSQVNADARLKTEKKRRRRVVSLLLLLLVLVALVAAFLFWNDYRTHTYRGMKLVNATDRADGNSVVYQYCNGNILKYSKDGASLLDASGKTYWNGGYEMNNPTVDACGDYVAIADVGGTDCYVYNGKDSGVKIDNDLPIQQVRVAGQGVVALLLQEEEANLLCLFNPYSSTVDRLVEVPTNVKTDGYPVDFALSPNAESLVAIYAGVANGAMESKLVFYNFSDVGREKNNLVGGKAFPGEVPGKVEFLGNNAVCVFREKGYTLYKNMKQPEEVRSEEFDKEIRSALVEKGTFGFLLDETNGEGGSRLRLYDGKGKLRLDKRVGYDYSEASLQGGEVVLRTNQSCVVIRKNGTEKWNYTFDATFAYLMKSKNRNRYYVIDELEIKELKLTEGNDE